GRPTGGGADRGGITRRRVPCQSCHSANRIGAGDFRLVHAHGRATCLCPHGGRRLLAILAALPSARPAARRHFVPDHPRVGDVVVTYFSGAADLHRLHTRPEHGGGGRRVGPFATAGR